MPGITSLTKSLTSQLNGRKSDAYLVDLDVGTKDARDLTVKSPSRLPFQYWPESITDSRAINYQQKEIPGGSLPLYQWINGGERLISFTAVFTTDVDLLSAEAPPKLFGAGDSKSKLIERLESSGVRRRNVDIRSAIAWLRQYMYPTYGNERGGALTSAPNKLILILPNSGIGLAGTNYRNPDSVIAVMTQCDVTYEQFFPNGLPRIASVSLAFAEVPNHSGTIHFPGKTPDMMDTEKNKTTGYTFNIKDRNGDE